MFSVTQIKELEADLKRSNVKDRTQAGRKLSYIEGWLAIAEANRIFGFDKWSSETLDCRQVAEYQRKVGTQGRDGWGVSYVAKVRVVVDGITREGTGAGHGIDVDLGLAHESAIKEAETDARKRALMTFGNPFGLALYDKTQANVDDGRPVHEEPHREPAPRDRRPSPPPPERTADSVSSRAAAPRNGNGRQPAQQSTPFDDPDEVGAYIAKFQTAVRNCGSIGDLDLLWKQDKAERFRLRIGPETSAYAQLTRIAADRKHAIEREVGEVLLAG